MYQELSTLLVIGLHALQQAFPNTSFPAGGPDDQWLAEHGFARYVQPVEALTQDQIIANLQGAVQNHLDTTARTRNYDGILSACTYATSTNPQFAAEGQACVEWRDACWSICYMVMSAVQTGQRPIPSDAGLLAELPEIGWP